jgi:hypothetical protein
MKEKKPVLLTHGDSGAGSINTGLSSPTPMKLSWYARILILQSYVFGESPRSGDIAI